MSSSCRMRKSAASTSMLCALAVAYSLSATEAAYGQEPSWHRSFDYGTSAGRSWAANPGISAPMRSSTDGPRNATSVWRQNQERLRHSLRTPPYPNYRTYGIPASRRWDEATSLTSSWTPRYPRVRRRLFGRRWR